MKSIVQNLSYTILAVNYISTVIKLKPYKIKEFNKEEKKEFFKSIVKTTLSSAMAVASLAAFSHIFSETNALINKNFSKM